MADHCLYGADGDPQPSHAGRVFQMGAVPPGTATPNCFHSGKANFGKFQPIMLQFCMFIDGNICADIL